MDCLTTDEVISLTAGVGFWRTHAIERLGIPPVKVSFFLLFCLSHIHVLNPGQRWSERYTRRTFFHVNTCQMSPGITLLSSLYIQKSHMYSAVQSATALGATWDTKLIEQVGFRLMAEEAKLRAVSLILAPTVNIQRVRMFCFMSITMNFQLTRSQSPLGGRVRRSIVLSGVKLTSEFPSSRRVSKVFQKIQHSPG